MPATALGTTPPRKKAPVLNAENGSLRWPGAFLSAAVGAMILIGGLAWRDSFNEVFGVLRGWLEGRIAARTMSSSFAKSVHIGLLMAYAALLTTFGVLLTQAKATYEQRQHERERVEHLSDLRTYR